MTTDTATAKPPSLSFVIEVGGSRDKGFPECFLRLPRVNRRERRGQIIAIEALAQALRYVNLAFAADEIQLGKVRCERAFGLPVCLPNRDFGCGAPSKD